jgi:hypothetical protein
MAQAQETKAATRVLFLIVKQCGIERYKDLLISSSPVPTFATGYEWHSQAIILRPGRLSSIMEIKRVEGPVFNSKEAAGQHDVSTVHTNHLRSLIELFY